VVERQLPKLYVEGSIPFARSNKNKGLGLSAELFSLSHLLQVFSLRFNELQLLAAGPRDTDATTIGAAFISIAAKSICTAIWAEVDFR
jgi:hypothetical protein